MFPFPHLIYSNWRTRCLWLALILCVFVIIDYTLPVKTRINSGLLVYAQSSSPLMTTPGLSTTILSNVMTVVRAQSEISMVMPLLYERTATNLQTTFVPQALLGITYKAGIAEQFDAATFLQSQAKVPVDVCKGLDNAWECTRARERYLLSQPQTGIVRAQDQLSISLTSGYTVMLHDVTGTGGGGYASYGYFGYIPELNQHHIIVYYFEGSDDILINAKTGETTVLPYTPIMSPDQKHFVVAGEKFAFPLTVQIWNTQHSRLNLEADVIVDNLDSQRFAGVTWMAPTKVRIDTVNSSTQITGTLLATLSPQGWQTTYNGQRIYAPALYPDSLFNSDVISAVDTVAVGKRIYADQPYKFKIVPASVNGQQYLLFANNNMRRTDRDYVHFTVAQPATVYVAMDMQASELPGWLKGSWVPTPDIVSTDDMIKLRLYKKTYDMGDEVTLGGNWAPPASGIRSHYLVIIAPIQN